MTAPDLPMRERIAEALFGRRDDPYDDRDWDELGSADKELWFCYADAVLAVLADLPDTAVEAGAEALFDATEFGRGSWNGLPEYVRVTWRDRAYTTLTATIAAIKEGKA